MTHYPLKHCGSESAHDAHDWADPSVIKLRHAGRHCMGVAPMANDVRAYRQGLTAFLPSVRVTDTTRDRVEARAKADGTSVADLVRTAVMEWLDAPIINGRTPRGLLGVEGEARLVAGAMLADIMAGAGSIYDVPLTCYCPECRGERCHAASE